MNSLLLCAGQAIGPRHPKATKMLPGIVLAQVVLPAHSLLIPRTFSLFKAFWPLGSNLN